MAALVLAWPLVGHAKGAGTISGKLKGAGEWASSPEENIIAVRAIAAETGETAAADRLTSSLSYKLKVQPGFYMVVAEAADLQAGQQFEDHSHLIELRAGQRKRANLSLKPGGGRGAAPSAPRAHRPAAGSRIATRGVTTKVLAVSPDAVVTGDTGIPGGIPISDMLTTDLASAKCPPDTKTDLKVVVHRRSKDWKALQDEIRLQNSPRVDPSSRVTPHFIRPGFEVQGGGQISNGTVSMEVRVVKIRGGAVVADASVSGPATSFFELLDQLTKQLIDELCGEEGGLFDVSSASGTYSWNFQESETLFDGSCTTSSNMQWDSTFRSGGAPFEVTVYDRDQQKRPIYGFAATGEDVLLNSAGNGVSTRTCTSSPPGSEGSSVCDLHQSFPATLTISAAPDESNATTTKMHWNYGYPQYSFANASRFGGSCTSSGPRPPGPSSHVSGGLFVSPINDPDSGNYTEPVGITEVPTSAFNGDTLSFTFSGDGSASFSDDDSQGSSSAQWSMTVSFTRR